jgi:deazaflavin-dependent oxidoreductase (nitroreductase family)
MYAILRVYTTRTCINSWQEKPVAEQETTAPGPEVPRWLRAAFLLPERLYRFGWGSLLGRRFLRLSHRGRRSGAPYATVLEVVAYDRRIPEFVVVSGFGARADWLRNIEAGGPVEVTVGRRTFPVEHRRLELDEALGVFADYERRNRAAGPILRRVLSWLLGWRYDGSPDARVRMAEQLPLIAFRPRTS